MVKQRSFKQMEVSSFCLGKVSKFHHFFPIKVFPDKIFPRQVFPDVFNQNWNYDVTDDLEPVTIFISRNVLIFRKQPEVFSCIICGIKTTRSDNMNRHMQRKQDATYKDEKALSARAICFYPNCNEKYSLKSKYIEHLSEKTSRWFPN